MAVLLFLSSQALQAEGLPKVLAVEVPPFVMQTEQGAKGFLNEVASLALHRIAQPHHLEIVPWARGFQAVSKGQGLALLPTIRTSERESQLLFGKQPLHYMEMAFFARPGTVPEWQGELQAVKGRRIVKLRGAAFSPELDSAFASGNWLIEETNSFSSALRMVAAGRVDLAAVPLLTGLYLLPREGLQDALQPLQPIVHRQPVYLALALGQEALLDPLDQALSEMREHGQIDAVIEAYRQRNWQPQPID
jgi:polar amino acid transport system substrate-binding protein